MDIKEIVADLGWVFLVVGMLGAVFNAAQSKAGYYIWMLGNSFWVVYDFYLAAYPQCALYVFFNCTCVYGVWKMGNQEKMLESPETITYKFKGFKRVGDSYCIEWSRQCITVETLPPVQSHAVSWRALTWQRLRGFNPQHDK